MKDLFEDVKSMIKEYFDSFKDNLFDFLDYLNIFKEFYEIVFESECDTDFISIFENIRKQTEKILKQYLPNYFIMFAFLSSILVIIYPLSSLYLHTYFISLIYVVIVLFIMLIYSYSIYKEFNIKGLDRIIFKFFIFLTLGFWIFLLFIVTHMTIVLSFESIFLNIMYGIIKDLIFYYIILLLIFPIKCILIKIYRALK
ncbi:MAG: hypothetical protein GU343_02600 [Nanoarchaeota archaeon]|jgi:hypothetical protein|nr:hypothetical protein [Nanoarchaeota archaeon]